MAGEQAHRTTAGMREALIGLTPRKEHGMKRATMSETADLPLCACGCGVSPRTKPSMWCAGHDARYKQRLIAEFDNGSAEAGQELIERGWMARRDLNLRYENVASLHRVQRSRLQDRLDRLNGQITRLEERRESLRERLVGVEELI